MKVAFLALWAIMAVAYLILFSVEMVLFVRLMSFKKNLRKMKKIIESLLALWKIICPKSRWGNLVYAILGIAVANYDNVDALIAQLVALFK